MEGEVNTQKSPVQVPVWVWFVLMIISGGTGGSAGGVLSKFLSDAETPRVPQQLTIQVDDAVLKQLNSEIAKLNANLAKTNQRLTNNWDKYDQWNFTLGAEQSFKNAGLNIDLPKPVFEKPGE